MLWIHGRVRSLGRRSLEACERLVRFSGRGPVRQDFQVRRIGLAGFLGFPQLLLANADPEGSDGVVILVVEGLAIAVERGAVVLPLEVKVAHLDVFFRLVRVPRLELLDTADLISFVQAGRVFGFMQRRPALRVRLGIIGRRTEVGRLFLAGTLCAGTLCRIGLRRMAAVRCSGIGTRRRLIRRRIFLRSRALLSCGNRKKQTESESSSNPRHHFIFYRRTARETKSLRVFSGRELFPPSRPASLLPQWRRRSRTRAPAGLQLRGRNCRPRRAPDRAPE